MSEVITLTGDLDLFTQTETRRLLGPLAHACHGIVDLRGARIGDATSLSDLLWARRANAALGGRIVLVASSPIRRLLDIVGFGALFSIVETLSEAYEILGRDGAVCA